MKRIGESELILNADGTIFHLHLKPEDIAASVLHILAAPKHVVIDELMIHPISQDY